MATAGAGKRHGFMVFHRGQSCPWTAALVVESSDGHKLTRASPRASFIRFAQCVAVGATL